jgi:NADPH:quinone reductase-like Zn-dependent oxidoreductase
MKAVVQDRYGLDALRLEDIAVPVAADGAVLVRVRAAGVNPLDWHAARGVPYVARMAMGMSALAGGAELS